MYILNNMSKIEARCYSTKIWKQINNTRQWKGGNNHLEIRNFTFSETKGIGHYLKGNVHRHFSRSPKPFPHPSMPCLWFWSLVNVLSVQNIRDQEMFGLLSEKSWANTRGEPRARVPHCVHRTQRSLSVWMWPRSPQRCPRGWAFRCNCSVGISW